jgi:transposase-like protein
MTGDVKGPRVDGEIVRRAVPCCCHGVGDSGLAEMLDERDVRVDRTTLSGWTRRYASEIERRPRW